MTATTFSTDIPDGFDYVGDVYRPPTEADSILLQASVGCSYGACTFCSGHRGKRFAIKPQETLERDIAFAEHYCKRQDRVFVMDGNALVMPTEQWVWLLERIRARLPWVRGVSTFASGKDIADKTDAELVHLRGLGLDRIYVGVESGSAAVLKRIRKGIGPEEMLAQCRRIKNAGMALYVSVILGIADEAESSAHARDTGELLSAINPDVAAVLTLIPHPGTPVFKEIRKGKLRAPHPTDILQELKELYTHTRLQGGLFDYGHSSGYFSFKAQLPEERAAGLEKIEAALRGQCTIKQEEKRRI